MITPVNLFYPNKNMAEFSREKSPDVDMKNSASLDNSLAEKDINVPQLSEINEAVNKLAQEPLISSETLSKEAASIITEVASIKTEVKCKSTDVPFVDIEALAVLESKAVEVDRNLHRMMDNITRNLNGISTSSVQYAECYRDCVKNVGNASDTATKAMAKLIGKCEEMNKNMEPLYNMAEQVKMINALLDQFEEKCK
jgi:hypothetical protein